MVLGAVLRLQLDLLGDPGIAVDLTVRMGHGDTDGGAAVLEDEDVLHLRIGGDIRKAVAPQIDELTDMGHRQLGQGDGVLGGIEDDLALAVGLRIAEKGTAEGIIGRLRVLGKGREIVVVFQNVKLIGHLAGARAEGAPVLGHLGTALAAGGDHDPIINEGMVTKFRHSF